MPNTIPAAPGRRQKEVRSQTDSQDAPSLAGKKKTDAGGGKGNGERERSCWGEKKKKTQA